MAPLFDKCARAAWLAASLLLLAGCAAPAGPPPGSASPPSPAPSQPSGETHCIIVPALQHLLRVVRVKMQPGDLLKIQVNVENLTSAPLNFRYRIEWFDKDGQLLPMAGAVYFPWKLRPGEVSSIAATSPVPTAADFGIAFLPAIE